MILVKTYYNTDAEGNLVPEHIPLEEMPITYHGPFDSMSDAVSWMENDWPDNDTDVHEQIADDFDLPNGTPINAPGSIHGDIPDEDIRDITDEQLRDLGPLT